MCGDMIQAAHYTLTFGEQLLQMTEVETLRRQADSSKCGGLAMLHRRH